MNFIPANIHQSWSDFLTEDIIKTIHLIEEFVEKEKNNNQNYILLPEEHNVLNFLTKDLTKVAKIWVGQDPYPETYFDEAGIEHPVANGRAFWPDDLVSWQQPFKQASMRNIMRNYYNEKFQHESDWRKIKKFSEIRKEIANGEINIKEPKEWFKNLENNGVLLLNTTFTLGRSIDTEVKLHSHIKLWSDFTKELIKYIDKIVPNAKWCIWGTVANGITSDIPEYKKQFSAHPSRCTVDKNNFLKNTGLF